jgi:hypothetical protein
MEIHPVYAIDLIDATSQENLSGVWGDNFGMTYYLHQVGDAVWWFGMGPVRNRRVKFVLLTRHRPSVMFRSILGAMAGRHDD